MFVCEIRLDSLYVNIIILKVFQCTMNFDHLFFLHHEFGVSKYESEMKELHGIFIIVIIKCIRA